MAAAAGTADGVAVVREADGAGLWLLMQTGHADNPLLLAVVGVRGITTPSQPRSSEQLFSWW